jgi:microcystin-dependent protein
MKAKFALVLFLLTSILSVAQTSEKGFSFQGFAIDPDGKALGSTAITVRFSVSPSKGIGGNYSETYSLTTDPFGVFNSIIGKGTKETGSADFKSLDFTKKGTVYKLKVEVKKTNGGIYTTINESDFNAVPYARLAENGVPVGTVVAYAGDKNNVPEGWLICDGTSVLQSDYPQLYAAIGSAWGASGSSFNVPDLRGMFLRGVNDGRSDAYKDPDSGSRVALKAGGNTGDKTGSIQAGETKSHNHSASASNSGAHSHNINFAMADVSASWTGNGYWPVNPAHRNNGAWNKSTDQTPDHTHTISIGNNGGNETRPVNAGVYYIIKY